MGELNQGSGTKQADFMKLYEETHARLSRFVHSMVWHREDAKDVINETVLTAYEKFETLRNREVFLYFLFGIATNLIRRRERRKKFWGVFDERKSTAIIDESKNIEIQDEVKHLYAALNKLPREKREAITLFEIAGFSLNEIREIQGGSLSGVKSRVARARADLANLLKAETKYADSSEEIVNEFKYQ